MKNVLLGGRALCKTFSQTGGNARVLDKIDIELYENDFTVIMGASGAGKSTLLYALSGMDSVTGGELTYKGRKINGLSEKEMAFLRANEFGFVFQQTHLVSNLTLFENVAVAGYAGKAHSPKEVEQTAAAVLEAMHLQGARNRLPAQVSGGEAQRAAIARAMINDPGLLFADEPTGALNKANSEQVLDLLSALNEAGQSILMVTHDMRAAIRGNRILYLEDGKLLDELPLPVFRKRDARERETALGEWLTALRW
ncbi:MAG: ABC transporter ATP-binding protein [Eubacteriales bacterium]|nr:ABC transporter ATP-binding protein [Eubacteriales bacterium]